MSFANKIIVVILKNLKIRRHHWIVSIFEFILPILLFVTLLLIRDKTAGLETLDIASTTYGTQLTSEALYHDKFHHDTKIYFAPNTYFVSELMYQIQLKFSLNIEAFKGFQNESDMVNSINYDEESILAIVFENLVGDKIPKQLKYSIRPYEKYVHWETDVLFNPFEVYIQDSGSEMYVSRGFLALQMALESSFIEMVSNKSLPINIAMEEFPYPPYLENIEKNCMIKYLLPLVTVLGFSGLCPLILSRVMEDKVSGMKELMKVMGLKSRMLWITWFLDAFFWNLTSMICISVMLVYLKGSANAPLLEHTSVTVLLVFLALYCSVVTTFCFAISCFFNKPLYAMVVAVVLWIITCTLSFSVDKLNVCLFLHLFIPNASLVYGFKIISEYETRGVGIQWNNVLESSSGQNSFHTMFAIFIALSVQIATCFFVIFYMSNGRFGVYSILNRRKLLLLWCKNLKIKKEERTLLKEATESKYVEKCDLPISVSLRHLYKSFGKNKAVNNLSIDFYKQQITVILGKNGAGKTTTLSIIAGILHPTHGDIVFNDLQSISICPQHNLHLHALTLLENLIFYGVLKGLSWKQALDEANHIITNMNLFSKKHCLPKELSGGMKRKLSVAIAIIASSNVVILDEPTAGLDPESRRDLWDSLLQLRRYRTIIVTTHLMEEAEVLGDQIAIIDHGALKCYGTPLFLRNVLGVGSWITVRLKSFSDPNKFLSEMDASTTIKCTRERISNEEFKLFFSNTTNHEIKNAVYWLEDRSDVLHIRLLKNTMEEIFLKACSTGFENAPPSLNRSSPFKHRSKIRLNLWTQCKTLSGKWFKLTKYKLHFFQILIMIGIVLSCLYIGGRNQNASIESNQITLDLNMYDKSTVLFSSNTNDVFLKMAADYYSRIVKNEEANSQIVKNVKDGIIQHGIDNFEYYKQRMIVAADFNNTNGNGIVTALYSNKATQGAPISLNMVSNALLKALTNDEYSITVRNHPLPIRNEERITHSSMIRVLFIWILFLPMGAVLMAGISLLGPQTEYISKIKHLQLMCGVSKTMYWFTCYVKDVTIYISSVLIVMSVSYFTNYLFQISRIFESEEIGVLFIILVAFGICAIPYSYIFSFTKFAFVGYSLFLVLSLLIGDVFMILLYFLKISHEDELDIHDQTNNYAFFLPSFGMKLTIMQLVKKAVWNYNWNIKSVEHKNAVCASKYNPCCSGENSLECQNHQSYFKGDDSVTYNIVAMLISTIAYFIILCILETWPLVSLCSIFKLFCKQNKKNSSKVSESASLVPEQYLQVNIEPQHRIVDNIQFEAKSGDYLGLLGANGAGKTTTFRLLTGEQYLKNGEINMKTKNKDRPISINNDKLKYLQYVGYCPQLEAVGDLTDGETLLRLFATLRNVEDVEQEVKTILNIFGLEECAKQTSSTYSGGCKRKLFTAIALIGLPPFIMLDEPTAGVDPDSRKKIWEALLMIKKHNPTVILSTHDFHECEKLCEKVVLIKSEKTPNEFKPIHNLKSEYKDDYTISLKLKVCVYSIKIDGNDSNNAEEDSNKIEKLKCDIDRCFVTNIKLDDHPALLKYQIKRKRQESLGTIFEKIQEIQHSNPIVQDYDISEATLETTFLNIMKK